ncbi:uncharacterized protein TNIN_310891 [Trichonephila inaurata madagascariensis]|uniref:Uncharacterized protein n=1 Tax=Trichonephila inaurata madagascariensis TaxID=2747483 RepID=A0A8X7C712_9ARAC|nr:uncharacterized protein TNIN_310891 [Trichonephila inaurata madagascariensis]
MKVMFTILYLTIGMNSLAFSMRPCLQDPKFYTIDEMEKLVYAVANEKGVPATVILNRIMRKVKYRQRMDKTKPKNPLQELAFQELIGTKYRPRPPGEEDSSLPTFPGQPPARMLPPQPPRRPVFQPPIRNLPPPSGHSNLRTGVFTTGFASPHNPLQPYPQSFFLPIQNLQPPPGVTIRVETGVRDGVLPEVIVTLSPMMTIVEALKQAESKFRSILGQPSVSDDSVISFSQVPSRRMLRHRQFQQCPFRQQRILEDYCERQRRTSN